MSTLLTCYRTKLTHRSKVIIGALCVIRRSSNAQQAGGQAQLPHTLTLSGVYFSPATEMMGAGIVSIVSTGVLVVSIIRAFRTDSRTECLVNMELALHYEYQDLFVYIST